MLSPGKVVLHPIIFSHLLIKLNPIPRSELTDLTPGTSSTASPQSTSSILNNHAETVLAYKCAIDDHGVFPVLSHKSTYASYSWGRLSQGDYSTGLLPPALDTKALGKNLATYFTGDLSSDWDALMDNPSQLVSLKDAAG
jgi:hypothetical protein